MNFRVECPKCHWGYGVKNDQINAGYLRVTCSHCGNQFWFILTLSDIRLHVSQDLPKGVRGDGASWVESDTFEAEINESRQEKS